MHKLLAKRGLGIASRHLAWVALGFFGMLLALAVVLARVGANRLLDATRWYGTLTAGEKTIGWNGRIILDRVQFVPHGADEAGALKAARVTVDTGGPLWLMRLALRRTSADRLERRRQELEAEGVLAKDDAPPVLPSVGRLMLSAEEVIVGPKAALTRWVPWLDPSSGVLFAALGCREPDGLSRAVAQRTGDQGRFDLRLQLQQERAEAVLSAAFVFGGISKATWEGHFLPSSGSGLLAGDWRQWQMLKQQWTLGDREFVRARNRECARRLALSRPQFVARHALAVKRQLALWNVALPAPLENAYREHASIGGEIVFVSRPKQPLRLGEYQLMSRSQKVGALEGQVTMAGRRLPLLLEFLPDAIAISAVAVAPAAAKKIDPTAVGAATVESAPPAQAVASVATIAPAKTPVPPLAATSTSSVKPTESAVPAVSVRTADVAMAGSPAAKTPPKIAVDSDPPAMRVVTAPARPTTVASVSPPQNPKPLVVAGTQVPMAATLPSQGNYRGLLGRRVTITTTYGTARTGKIRIANKVAVTLEMQTNDGPIQLRIPAEQIVQVRTVPL